LLKPAETEANLPVAIKDGALRMLESLGVKAGAKPANTDSAPGAVEMQLAAEKRAAAEAAQAIEIVTEKIRVATLRYNHLRGRQAEFVGPVLEEIAAPLSQKYLKALAQLRETAMGRSAPPAAYRAALSAQRHLASMRQIAPACNRAIEFGWW
jgi:hypothetical protein